MKDTKPVGLETAKACWLALAATGLMYASQTSAAYGQEGSETMPGLQQKIIAAAEKAKPSVVRIVWRHDNWDDNCSGVIITMDGYIATYLYRSYKAPEFYRYETHIPPGQAVSVYLADGWKVSGMAVGSLPPGEGCDFRSYQAHR